MAIYSVQQKFLIFGPKSRRETMRRYKRAVLLMLLVGILSPFAISQLRNLSEYSRDCINTAQTHFVLHDTGAAEFGWASEWTHTTANANDGKSAIFIWHFKDGSKAYSEQGDGIGEIGKNSSYLLTNASSNLEDIHRKKIQPLTLNNYPVKVELWIGEIGNSAGYSPEILGDEACFKASSIEYNTSYKFSSCRANEKEIK
jgi:hypothetical protein